MQGLTPPDEHVDHVWHRVEFARRRRRELFLLNDGDVPGADLRDRQPLIQEFFFHLVGAIDFVAQHIGQRRNGPSRLSRASAGSPRARRCLGGSLRPSAWPGVPDDPLRDAAVVFRLWNYRHQVAHRGANPFMFTIQLGGPTDGARGAHLLVDPRDPGGVHVSREARDDLEAMVELAERRLRATFDRLQAYSVR